jgi:phage gp46-like protein
MSYSFSYLLPVTQAPANPQPTSPAAQVVDVKLVNAADGGDIEILGGLVTMSSGLDVAVYLSLFGGNELDSGLQGDDSKQFWANLGETDPAKMYRSRTQSTLLSLPAVPANMLRVQDAVNADLSWMLVSVASSIDVVVSMPALNHVSIAINITVADRVYTYVFAQQWSQSK